MRRQKLFPYPRIGTGIEWGQICLKVDDQEVAIESVAENWDNNSVLSASLTVTFQRDSIVDLGADDVRLTLTAMSPATSFVISEDSSFYDDGKDLKSTVQMSFEGDDIAQQLTLQAQIIGRDKSNPLLSRRILAERRATVVQLESDFSVFPTTQYSFSEKSIPSAPWRLIVDADDLSSPFANSIRLELNSDFKKAKREIERNSDSTAHREVSAAILRVQIATVSRLASDSRELQLLEETASENPDSFAAAAKRASELYLKQSLRDSVRQYREEPERLEYAIAHGVRTLEE